MTSFRHIPGKNSENNNYSHERLLKKLPFGKQSFAVLLLLKVVEIRSLNTELFRRTLHMVFLRTFSLSETRYCPALVLFVVNSCWLITIFYAAACLPLLHFFSATFSPCDFSRGKIYKILYLLGEIFFKTNSHFICFYYLVFSKILICNMHFMWSGLHSLKDF